MLSSNLLLKGLLQQSLQNALKMQAASIHNRSRIGNRDWVGYGVNGQAIYVDRTDFPMPAIRFMDNSNELMALKEKEKGDWKKLSIAEKKQLYRASFCQTFAEFEAPTGEWKTVIGLALFFSSFSLWIYMAAKKFVYGPLPDSCSDESRAAQLQRMLDLRIAPITGLSSQWDFEKNEWKK